MRRRVLVVAVLMLPFVGCTAGPVADGHSWTTSVAEQFPTIVEEHHTMPVAGLTRTWLLQRPLDQRVGERLPVVIVLHGHLATAETMAGHFEDRVASRRFIAVYPQGWGETWNIGSCCWPAVDAAIDDAGFFDEILDHLVTRRDVDADRISISGGSLGGTLVFAYACDRADRLAGLVSIAGTRLNPCLPNAPIPTMQVHSLVDDSLSYYGGPTLTGWLMGLDFPAVVPSLEAWAAANGECPAGPDTSQEPVMPIATATVWDCGGTVTRLETLSEGGHAWPIVGDYVVVDQLLEFLL
jgi:polyhydroxybutyrate depolymerase